MQPPTPMQILRTNAIRTLPTLVMFACAAQARIQLEPLGQYATGVFEEGAAEISAFEPGSRRLFVTNAFANAIDVVDLSDPSAPLKLFSIDMSPFGAGVNSVDVRGGVVAAAVEVDPKTDPGQAVLLDLDGNLPSAVTVGALPDMITFDPAGRRVLVANEAEPSDDYSVDRSCSRATRSAAACASSASRPCPEAQAAAAMSRPFCA